MTTIEQALKNKGPIKIRTSDLITVKGVAKKKQERSDGKITFLYADGSIDCYIPSFGKVYRFETDGFCWDNNWYIEKIWREKFDETACKFDGIIPIAEGYEDLESALKKEKNPWIRKCQHCGQSLY
jgi:hypothetical protein